MPIYNPSVKSIPRLIQEFPNENTEYVGAMAMPMNTTEFKGWDIEQVVEKGGDGQTAPHVLGTNPRIIDGTGWDRYRDEPIPFKEKEVFDERQILKLADLRDERQRFEVNKWVARTITRHNRRIDVRVETSRWEPLATNALNINVGEIKVNIPDFGIPSGNFINVANNWNNPVTGKPAEDMETALAKFDGFNVTKVTGYCNHKVGRYLSKNEDFLDRLAGTQQIIQLTPGKSPELFKDLTDLDSLMVSRQYWGTSGARLPFIPDNKLILIGEEQANGPTCEWVSVPSLHRGTVENPEAGKFAFANFDHMQPEDENPHGFILSGIYGRPVIWKPWLIVVINVNPN